MPLYSFGRSRVTGPMPLYPLWEVKGHRTHAPIYIPPLGGQGSQDPWPLYSLWEVKKLRPVCIGMASFINLLLKRELLCLKGIAQGKHCLGENVNGFGTLNDERFISIWLFIIETYACLSQPLSRSYKRTAINFLLYLASYSYAASDW